jgi:hypothetical protein
MNNFNTVGQETEGFEFDGDVFSVAEEMRKLRNKTAKAICENAAKQLDRLSLAEWSLGVKIFKSDFAIVERWIPPFHPFIEYEASDEKWCRYFGIGEVVREPGIIKVQVPSIMNCIAPSISLDGGPLVVRSRPDTVMYIHPDIFDKVVDAVNKHGAKNALL